MSEAEHYEQKSRMLAEMRALDREKADLQNALDAALAELEQWRATAAILQQSQHDAWVLLGKVDYLLETMDAQTQAARRRMAAQIRREIKRQAGPR